MNKITKLFGVCLASMAVLFSACSKSADKSVADSAESKDSKSLVAYFSASGVTEKQAERLAELTNATLFEIQPVEPYTAADLAYGDDNSRSSKEKADPGIRPAIKNSPENLSSCDTVYIGYPIWWDTYPNIVATFIESNKEALDGKVVLPFATSGGSSIDNSVKNLQANFPYLKVGKGLLMNDVDDQTILDWSEGK